MDSDRQVRVSMNDAVLVAPDHFGRGIGRAIVDHLESRARTHAVPRLSPQSTPNAAPFYRSLGFVGETVGVYESPRGVSLACMLMTTWLGP